MAHRISKTSKNLAVAKAAPSTEQVSKLAYSLVKDVMTKCLDSESIILGNGMPKGTNGTLRGRLGMQQTH